MPQPTMCSTTSVVQQTHVMCDLLITCDELQAQGRNELIARYIKLRTGKTRTRKQVSSHIQVLARRKAREIQVKLKDQVAKDKVMQSMSTMSSAQIISATAFQNKMALQGLSRPTYPTAAGFHMCVLILDGCVCCVLQADLSINLQDDSSFFYGVSSQYESSENMIITSSTKVCSFGKQVVEKVETEYARFENGRYVFRIHRSPLCEYMINFIHKLKHLPEKYMMNSVLENFTILQVVTNRDTLETLLCIAYVFEVSTSEHGAQHHIYRLVKD
ncbi:transcriptional enhancer factor TEF-3-like [Sinocyclocheilus grahami]|uniref:transcriptional enhancer factor TEF-3-like n=1 Tax=Sinocyclocheilus grahami TaxID=75366 RepID=UPI0007AC6262|nr:PREDICTED: transcriptional enhancer factor TEF-3-like [Sinocyclocheilus grahami]